MGISGCGMFRVIKKLIKMTSTLTLAIYDGSTVPQPLPIIAIAPNIAGDNIISPGEAAAVVISGTTTNVEDGQSVSITIEDSGDVGVYANSATVTSNAWTLTSNLSALNAGESFTLKVVVTNALGVAANDSRAISTEALPVPTIAISALIAGDNIISPAEAPSVVISGTTVNVEDGRIVTISIEDELDAQVFTDTATVTANAWTLTANLSALAADQLFSIIASVTNTAGTLANGSRMVTTPALVPSIAIAALIAGDNSISEAEAPAVVISGTTINVINNELVTVTIESSTNTEVFNNTATVTANVWTLTANLALLESGNYTIKANVLTASEATRSIIIEAAALDFSGLPLLTQAQRDEVGASAIALATGKTKYTAQDAINALVKLTSAWPFDDPGDLANDKYGTNDGTAGALVHSTDFLGGSVSGFTTGGTNITIPDDPSLQVESGMLTIAAWFKITSAGSGTIVGRDRQPDRDFLIFLAGNKPNIFVGASGIGITRAATGNPILNQNEWHFVVGRFDTASNSITIRVNDITELSGDATGMSSAANTTFRIGSNGDGGFVHPGLEVGPVYVFSEALTDSEYEFLYNDKNGNLIPLPS